MISSLLCLIFLAVLRVVRAEDLGLLPGDPFSPYTQVLLHRVATITLYEV
jgi:hypothetical protein